MKPKQLFLTTVAASTVLVPTAAVFTGASPVLAWKTQQSAEAKCVDDHIVINGTFINTEPAHADNSMNVTANVQGTTMTPDMQVAPATDPDTPVTFTLVTDFTEVLPGNVTFNLSWTNGHPGTDKREAHFEATGPCEQPEPEKKVFVCKYVGTPGVDERLQTGDNPISVSVNSIPDPEGDGVHVGDEFADQHGRSIVIAFDEGQPEPDLSMCPPPDAPTLKASFVSFCDTIMLINESDVDLEFWLGSPKGSMVTVPAGQSVDVPANYGSDGQTEIVAMYGDIVVMEGIAKPYEGCNPPKEVPAPAPSFTEGDCTTQPTANVPPATADYTVTVTGEPGFGNTMTVTFAPIGNVVLTGQLEYEHTFQAKPSDEVCNPPTTTVAPTTAPPTTAAPTTAPPTTAGPTTTVAFPTTTAAPTTTVTPVTNTLPKTGNDSEHTAQKLGIAFALVLCGGALVGLVRYSRRRSFPTVG